MNRTLSHNETKIKGKILEIQRMSTEDGPGIRTTVFMKGCGLQCTWCHNPESISFKSELQWLQANCIACKICINTCPDHALSDTEDGITINRDICKACGTCVEECPSGALEMLGEDMSVDELFKEVIKDNAYFETSKGGVTISGGEPALQADFVAEFAEKLRKKGIHTALDTCGFSSKESYEKILPNVDLVLFDIKEIDPEKHTEFTGKSNERILQNLLFVNEYIQQYKKELWIRTPIIPGATATDENITGIGNFISENNIHITKWELCAFNNLCNDKYKRLGKKWDFEQYELLDSETMEMFNDLAKKSGVNPETVFHSGSVKLQVKQKTAENNQPKPTDYCKLTNLPD